MHASELNSWREYQYRPAHLSEVRIRSSLGFPHPSEMQVDPAFPSPPERGVSGPDASSVADIYACLSRSNVLLRLSSRRIRIEPVGCAVSREERRGMSAGQLPSMPAEQRCSGSQLGPFSGGANRCVVGPTQVVHAGPSRGPSTRKPGRDDVSLIFFEN